MTDRFVVVELTATRIGHLLDLALKAEEYIKQLRAYARARLDEGKPVRGWKLVRGRGQREWKDEAEAEAVLSAVIGEEAAFQKRKLISPAQFEHMVGKGQFEWLEELVVHRTGSLVMAPESDKRPAAELLSAEDEFAMVVDETGSEG